MDEQTPPPHYQKHPAVEIAQMFFQLLTLALTLYIANMGSNNKDKIEQIGAKQEVAAERQEEVKVKLQSVSEKDQEATTIQLWNAWKNLEWIAEESGLATDRAKAMEARKIYEQFRQNGKK